MLFKVKIIINICKLVMFLTMFLHWIACIWNIVVNVDGPTEFLLQEDGTYMNSFGGLLTDASGI